MTDNGVCVVTHPLSGAGENATRTLLDILDALGPVHLITADLPEESTIWDDHDVDLLTDKGMGQSIHIAVIRFILNQVKMCRAILDTDASVVLFFGATAYLLPILFARIIGKRVLVEPRGDVPLTLRLQWETRMPSEIARLLAFLVKLFERAGYALAHRVVTYTPNMARQLGLNPESRYIYPHGARYVDTDRFDIQIPLEERENVVGFVGRIDEEKGIRDLAMAAKHISDDITFRFIGDGPLIDWLRRELEDEMDAGRVEVKGWIDHEDIPEELNKIRLLVMPSHPTEGLPTTILEAMACGTPTLSTPVSGVPDAVIDGETGFHLQYEDGNQIANIVEKLLTGEKLSEVSIQGRELILNEFCFEEAVRRYRTLLNCLYPQ